MTLKFCLEQLGHAIILIPRLLRFKLFKISHPIFISSTGSDAREILIVSPIPSAKRSPRPIDDLTEPAL